MGLSRGMLKLFPKDMKKLGTLVFMLSALWVSSTQQGSCDQLPVGSNTWHWNEAGNEAGFVVAITSCKPEPGTMYVEPMEELHSEAYYRNAVAHTGVMSVFFLCVADPVTYIAEVTE